MNKQNKNTLKAKNSKNKKIESENIEIITDDFEESDEDSELIDDEFETHEDSLASFEIDNLDTIEMDNDPFSLSPVKKEPAYPALNSLHNYLQEIRRFPLLEPEEEYLYGKQVQENADPDAAFKLISSHLRLVVRIAMDFQRRWMQNVLDLVQEGNIGLVRAVSKFDPDKGIRFSYYASFWIKAYILKFIMDNWRMVKIGTTQAQRKLFYNLNKERQKLSAQGYDPDVSTLAKNLKVSEAEIIEMQQRMDSADMSLNLPINKDESSGAVRMDFLPAGDPSIEYSLASKQVSSIVQKNLNTLLPELNDKEQYLLTYRLLTDDPITLREIGEKFGITRERVRQIEARLLEKIKKHLTEHIDDFSEEWIEQE